MSKAIGKLQFRIEENFWNAYYAENNREPVFLGSIATALTDDNKRRQMQFISLMEDLFCDIILKKFGLVVEFDNPTVTVSASEREQNGEERS